MVYQSDSYESCIFTSTMLNSTKYGAVYCDSTTMLVLNLWNVAELQCLSFHKRQRNSFIVVANHHLDFTAEGNASIACGATQLNDHNRHNVNPPTYARKLVNQYLYCVMLLDFAMRV